MKKPHSLLKLPDNIILCTLDNVGLYPSIPHDEGLPAQRKGLDLREEKVTTSTLVELARVGLKENIVAKAKL